MKLLNPVTPWSATVDVDINDSTFLHVIKRIGFLMQLHNTGESLWLVVEWPEGGRIAFRLAFGINSEFEQPEITERGNGFLIKASTRLAHYQIVLEFPSPTEKIVRYSTTFRAKLPMLIPFWPGDIVPLTKGGRIENTSGRIHTHQVGPRSGQLYFSMTRPRVGSVFYFQNLTSMSEYCQVAETSLAETVGGSWPEVGFHFPVNKEKPIPADREFVISDAYLVLDEEIPDGATEIITKYLDNLAAVYMLLPKPDPARHDWPELAEKALRDLSGHKGCWRQIGGTAYLVPYVADYKTPPEIMVQLAVLLPLLEYLEWKGEKHPVFDHLNQGLDEFYDKNIKSMVRWHPAVSDELDQSEEQKQDMVMDSWYLHHPMLNLARLALKGDATAKRLFLDSIDYVIKVAHHFKYEWPVFYKMTTLEVIKSETSPGEGGEDDVPGSYAHVMLMAWQLTGETRFMTEAKRALKYLDDLGFDIFYQANNTAFAAGALLELYKETGDKHYLQLSYCCLAGVLKNVMLWDCGYGHGRNFPNFFAVYPLNDAPYTAAYEELEVYAALHHYLVVADGVDILPSLKILLPEFIRYTTGRLPYYYPPMLPEEMISKEVKTGGIVKDLWIPLEDIYDGWELCGQVGQEVYGAGLPFGIVARQHFRLYGTEAVAFVDYPFTGLRNGKRSVTFRLIGDPRLTATLIISGLEKKLREKLKVEQKHSTRYATVKGKGRTATDFELRPGSQVRISW